MKVYVLEKRFLSPDAEEIQRAGFTSAGKEVVIAQWSTPQEVIAGAKDADAIMVMAIAIDAQVMDAMPNLKFIGRTGIGVDNVDLAAATERGIVVCNVPDHCNHEVASQSFTMMMALKRKLIPFIARAKEGGYAQGQSVVVHRLKGQTLGVIGYGKIGREIAKMGLGMGMNIAVFDPFIKELNESGVTLYSNFEDVLKISDAISLHLPLTPETEHMISMPQLKLMKKDAVLINASRGGIVKTDDLIEALKAGIIEGAALDVCEGEPLPVNHELLAMDHVIFTPHVGMYSEEATNDMHQKLVNQALDVLAGRSTANIVNPEVKEKAGLK